MSDTVGWVAFWGLITVVTLLSMMAITTSFEEQAKELNEFCKELEYSGYQEYREKYCYNPETIKLIKVIRVNKELELVKTVTT